MGEWKEVGKLIYSGEILKIELNNELYQILTRCVKQVLEGEIPYELIYENGGDCGYLSLSKSGKVVSIVVKRERYIANLKEARQVAYGARDYTAILKSVEVKI